MTPLQSFLNKARELLDMSSKGQCGYAYDESRDYSISKDSDPREYTMTNVWRSHLELHAAFNTPGSAESELIFLAVNYLPILLDVVEKQRSVLGFYAGLWGPHHGFDSSIINNYIMNKLNKKSIAARDCIKEVERLFTSLEGK